jgi:hypothetical protein
MQTSITKEQLEALYLDQCLSTRGCAKAIGSVSPIKINSLLKFYGIVPRPSGFQKGNTINNGKKSDECNGWKGGKQTTICDACGKELVRFPSLIHDINFCNAACRGLWRSKNFKGENNPNHGSITMFGCNNPNWMGGITSREYCEIWKDREFKSDIKERDGHKCQNPDCRGNSKKLDVHHIDYNKKNCHPKNLITVCTSCNARANFNREFWKAGYQEIIKNKYNP